jgi:uncharacterized protein (TIGR02421 family)
LHCADILSTSEKISDEETGKIITEQINFYGFKAKVEYVSNLASKALASGTNLVKIRENEVFDTDEAIALAHHEVGIHMLTSMNAKEQRLKFLQVGLPGSTETQEGLAVFSEFMSGKIKVARLKELALRTIAIDYMVKGADFLECYNTLIAKYNTIPDKSFDITARVYRGGGFTKDFVYLRGFKKILDMYHAKKDLSLLLVGKTSVRYYDLLNELMNRKAISKPKYVSQVIKKGQQKNEIMKYIVKGIL